MALTANQTIEQCFRTWVIGQAGITALMGTRFYPVPGPQNPTAPYALYRRVSSVRESSHSGPSCLAHPRFQVDWIGAANSDGMRGYDAALELVEVVRKLIQDFRGTWSTIRVDRVIVVDERDYIDPDVKIVGRSVDYEIWHYDADS